MAIKLSFRIFFLVTCLCVLASAIAAQDEKPQATQFAVIEYSNNEEKLPLVYEKLNSFFQQLDKEPQTTRGFIRIAENGELAKRLIPYISANSKYADRILFYGNLKAHEIISFSFGLYIVPKDAEIPYGCVIDVCECPILSVASDSNAENQKSLLTFRTKVSGGEVNTVITYNWKVSAGAIIEGQGTPLIKVDAKGAKEIKATVEISGVCEDCNREATAEVYRKLYLADDFGRATIEEIQARLDSFLESLQNNPNAQGYIINYGSGTDGRRTLARRITFIRNQFLFRSVDISRISFINGGYREVEATELWLSFY